jgi:hypothetical protein
LELSQILGGNNIDLKFQSNEPFENSQVENPSIVGIELDLKNKYKSEG